MLNFVMIIPKTLLSKNIIINLFLLFRTIKNYAESTWLFNSKYSKLIV